MEWWKEQLHSLVPADISKTFFLYHLLFEMWLDRVLMSEQPDADQQMYFALEKVNTMSLKEFAVQVLDDRKTQLVESFRGFQRRRFVSQYRKPETFAEIALGVFGDVTTQTINRKFRDNMVQGLRN